MAKITNFHDFTIFIEELAGHRAPEPGHLEPGASVEVSDELAERLHAAGVVHVEGKDNEAADDNLSPEEKQRNELVASRTFDQRGSQVVEQNGPPKVETRNTPPGVPPSNLVEPMVSVDPTATPEQVREASKEKAQPENPVVEQDAGEEPHVEDRPDVVPHISDAKE